MPLHVEEHMGENKFSSQDIAFILLYKQGPGCTLVWFIFFSNPSTRFYHLLDIVDSKVGTVKQSKSKSKQ